jgi:hypothetical protein
MRWQDQRPQEHGFFGHGTSSGNDGGGLFGDAGLGARIDATAQTVIAHLPQARRAGVAAMFDARGLTRLRAAAVAAADARSHADLAAAGGVLAGVMQSLGLDNFPR